MAGAQWIAETLLKCCAYWNLLENHPLGCWGKLFMGKCLTRSGPLLLGWGLRAAGHLHCRNPLLEKLPWGGESRNWPRCKRPPRGTPSNPEVKPSSSSVCYRPLLAKFNIVPPGKGKLFKGTGFIFKERANMMDLELRVNKLITGTESLVSLLQVRKLRLRRGEAAQPVLGFALLYKVLRKQIAKLSMLCHYGNNSTNHKYAHTLQHEGIHTERQWLPSGHGDYREFSLLDY